MFSIKKNIVPIIVIFSLTGLISVLAYKSNTIINNNIIINDSIVEETMPFAEFDEYEPIDIGLLSDTTLSIELENLEEVEYENLIISPEEIKELEGYIKYGTNLDDNFNKLKELVPQYLATNYYVQDIINNNNINMISKFINENTYITFLSCLYNPSLDIYITQVEEDTSHVYRLINILGYNYRNSMTVDSTYLIHATTENNDNNMLLFVGSVNGELNLLTTYFDNNFISLHDTGNSISIGANNYIISVLKDKIIFSSIQGGDVDFELLL